MPVTTVTRRYHFEAGHWLPKVRDGHKCKRPHGHNYELEVTIGGTVGNDGFIIDFWDLDDVVSPLIADIDHRMLNEIDGLQNPTAENIALWFLDRLVWALPPRHDRPGGPTSIHSVLVYETKDCWAKVTR